MNNTATQYIHIIDDDPNMRLGFELLFNTCGYSIKSYAHTNDILNIIQPDMEGCFIVDVRMPDLDGLAFQQWLIQKNVLLPVIFVSGYADVALSVQAMRQGAYTFLTKPFREQDLLDAVAGAMQLERDTREARREQRRFQAALETLSPRERQVMDDITEGRLNKTIAIALGVSEITVKVIRSRILRKMGAASAIQLARIAERLKR